MRKLFVAAALVAGMCSLSDGAVKAKARTRSRFDVSAVRAVAKPNRVKVQATTREVMPTARNGQFRWQEWDRLSSPQNTTTTPAQRPR
jgi:hypothetical protein